MDIQVGNRLVEVYVSASQIVEFFGSLRADPKIINSMTQKALVLYLLFVTAFANAGDYDAGKRKAFICAECHGERGNSVLGIYPNLSGQKYEYLVIALSAYKSGLRTNEIMQAMVMNLTKQDIQNLAAYYSQQSCQN